MSEFIRPQVQVEEINETSARVSVEPLERGYGDTLGNFVVFFCPRSRVPPSRPFRSMVRSTSS